MKNKMVYFLALLSSIMFICNSAFSTNYNDLYSIDTTAKEYKILKIERVKKAYIIKVCNEKDSTWYAVVSLKGKAKKCSKIKVGKSYKMSLTPYFNEDMFPDHAICFRVIIGGITIPVKSEGWAGNVYTTPNLKGLYYISL
jgi:hypothetical protein